MLTIMTPSKARRSIHGLVHGPVPEYIGHQTRNRAVVVSTFTRFTASKKVKERIAVNGTSISQLRDVTCHMGSHSVTMRYNAAAPTDSIVPAVVGAVGRHTTVSQSATPDPYKPTL